MPAAALAMISGVTTADVAPRDRIGFWEDYQECLAGGVPAPMVFGRGALREGELVSALGAVLDSMVRRAASGTPGGGTEQDVLDLIKLLGGQRSGGRPVPGAYQAHFTRVYRARFGGTPGEARGRAGR